MSEKGSERGKPTRKDRRAAQRKAAKQAPKPRKDFDPSRRKFLIDAAKIITPGGWIPDARKKGLTHLPTSAKISLAKDVVLSGGLTALVGQELTRDKSLKEKIEGFTWNDAREPEKLRIFADQLAEAYVNLTKTTRVDKVGLTQKGKLNFYPTRQDFVAGVRQVNPDYTPFQDEFGHTNYNSGRVDIDLGSLEDQSIRAGNTPGTALVGVLWHEWGHVDVTSSTDGELINNAANPGARINTNHGPELIQAYRGGEMLSATGRALHRFEEVWNETNTIRRIAEEVGFRELAAARNYYENGVDFFFDFTRSVGIPLETSYQMHANSQLDEFAILVGSNLPGDIDPFIKGMNLFDGISQNNRGLIEETGVFSRIPRP